MSADPGGVAVRLRVDLIACDGRGLCAEALTELITLDDWGFPVATGRAVPSRLLADVRATVRACPKLALRLEYVQPAAAGSAAAGCEDRGRAITGSDRG